jgi:hypothetical protein
VIGFATFFANAAMRFFWKNFLISIPEIAEGMTASIRFWDLVP